MTIMRFEEVGEVLHSFGLDCCRIFCLHAINCNVTSFIEGASSLS